MMEKSWNPEIFAARLPNLVNRQVVLRAVRDYFANASFHEVQTPALQISPGMEAHLMAFKTEYTGWDGQEAREFYLHTSPEFAMKKLLAAGAGNIFQICPTYRNRGEHSRLHQPEFQMLEWYRSHADYKDLFADCMGLLRAVAQAVTPLPLQPQAAREMGEVASQSEAGEGQVTSNPSQSAFGGQLSPGESGFRHGDITSNPFADWQIISVAEAFQHYANIDLYATTPNPMQPDREALAAACCAQNIYVSDTATWDDLFFKVMGEKIEPFLGSPAPTILYDYPASMAALARKSTSNPNVCERFELFVCGIELGNAFGELTDAAEQRRRFEADMDLKEKLYGIRYPIDEDFLAAVAAMPPAAGIALGVDRLIMLACAADKLEDVLWLPMIS